MHYRVGQRVRFLHESGEGVITALVDRYHVEVDMGDDFPMDVHVDELIPVDTAESKYLGGKQEEIKVQTSTTQASKVGNIQKLGGIFTLSMAICPMDKGGFEFLVINPGLADAVYTCYTREKNNKYTGMASGRILRGKVIDLFKLEDSQLKQIKSFYWQVLLFNPGKNHPNPPIIQEIEWNKGKMLEKTKYVESIMRKAWIFSLTQQESDLDRKMKIDSEFMRVKKADVQTKEEKVIDLHIEVLVNRPWELSPSNMLEVQLEAMEKGMSQALIDNYRSLVLIHGVGEGVLRKEIRKRLKQVSYVQSFEPADPKRFGNGATKVYFK